MEKLTLSIRSKEKIASAKAIAKANKTSLSKLFEEYLDALIAFDRIEVTLDQELQNLKQSEADLRPSKEAIHQHLVHRRRRS